MILRQGKNKSEANNMDEDSSRKSESGVTWKRKISPEQGHVFNFAQSHGKSHCCITESHILREISSLHLECEILGDINWSFTNVWRQRELETENYKASHRIPSNHIAPTHAPQATATWSLPKATVLRRVSGSVAAKTIFNSCTGWLNQRKTKKASQEARKKWGIWK